MGDLTINKIKSIILVIFAALFFFQTTHQSSASAVGGNPARPVYMIPVSGEVGPAMSAFIKRAVGSVPKTGNPLIVFEMDTFGGRVDSAFQIVDIITGISGAETLAYVKTKAISAGALIALSANRLIMAQNTTIGDCAPISQGPEGPVMLGEKFQSPLRAKFRALAKKNGYNEKLSEAMVSTDFEITRVEINEKIQYLETAELASLSTQEKAKIKNRKIVVKKGQLLTMDSTEARELGFSKATVTGIEEGLKSIGIANVSITPLNKTWTETFLGLLITISPILIMIGMAAVYMEMKMPGFGTPGIVGILCLGLAFGSQFAIGMANYAELLIILLGVLLLGLEVFVIPGFGVAGIAGFILIGTGFVLALQDFVIPKPSMPWQKQLLIHNVFMVFGSYILAVIAGLLMIRYVFPRFSIGHAGPYLMADLKDARADSHEIVKIKIGDEGIAMSYLRPAGKMKKGEDYFDVISEGEFIEKDTPVIVVRISGNRIIVTRKEPS